MWLKHKNTLKESWFPDRHMVVVVEAAPFDLWTYFLGAQPINQSISQSTENPPECRTNKTYSTPKWNLMPFSFTDLKNIKYKENIWNWKLSHLDVHLSYATVPGNTRIRLPLFSIKNQMPIPLFWKKNAMKAGQMSIIQHYV